MNKQTNDAGVLLNLRTERSCCSKWDIPTYRAVSNSAADCSQRPRRDCSEVTCCEATHGQRVVKACWSSWQPNPTRCVCAVIERAHDRYGQKSAATAFHYSEVERDRQWRADCAKSITSNKLFNNKLKIFLRSSSD